MLEGLCIYQLSKSRLKSACFRVLAASPRLPPRLSHGARALALHFIPPISLRPVSSSLFTDHCKYWISSIATALIIALSTATFGEGGTSRVVTGCASAWGSCLRKVG